MKHANSPDVAEALADNLTQCADALHQRVLNTLSTYKGAPVPPAEQKALHALLDQEMVLRQRANGMYADAAIAVANSLGAHKVKLTSVTQLALERIKSIARVTDAVGLAAALATFAGAAVAGQPAGALVALEKLDAHMRSMAA